MSLGGELTRKRFGGHGVLLLPLLAILLLVPLCRQRGTDHPLAGAEHPDLCALLPPAPLPLGEVHADASRPGTCAYRDVLGQDLLNVGLSTTREVSRAGGGAADTERMFEIWMKEVRASYGNGTDLPAPAKNGWRHAGMWKQNERQALVFEDGGVMVAISSPELGADRLVRYAEGVQQALRARK